VIENETAALARMLGAAVCWNPSGWRRTESKKMHELDTPLAAAAQAASYQDSALEIARSYVSRGWSPVPIPFRGKGPRDKDWQLRQIDSTTVAQFFNGLPQNVGIELGPKSNGLTDVDLDCAEAAAIAPYLLPPTTAIFGRASSRASHWLYVTDLAGKIDKAAIAFDDPDAKRFDRKARLLELRVGGGGKGAQTVFPGSVHEEGEPITWEENGDPANVDGDDLQRRVRLIAAACLIARNWPAEGGRHQAALTIGGFFARAGLNETDIATIVQAIARAAGDEEWKDRVRAAKDQAAYHLQGSDVRGRPKLADLVGEATADRIAEWIDYKSGVEQLGIFRATGDAPGADPHRAQDRFPKNRKPQDSGVRTQAFTDDALALTFADTHESDLRFVAKMGQWFHWDEQRWRSDDTLLARDRAREICRSASNQCNDPKIGKTIASGRVIGATERLAQSDRRLAATVDQFDADPWVLNTPSGIVDLRSGQVRPHDQLAYLTKITTVAPDRDGDITTWLSFLNRITDGNQELVDYLQRMVGYSLTGSTQEHALFFLYGTGANGKTTFLNAITGLIGDYHKSAPIETFTDSKNDRHPTELAMLRGARLVTAIETEEGRRWAESRIKQLTGGDRVSARFMRQDFFEFTPAFKLVVAGNNKPGLRSVDEAIRRRLNLIPFIVTIPPAERDQELGEKLQAEAAGILAWMIQGCADWQTRGLAPPQVVTDATAKYLEAEDAIAAWLDDKCQRDPQAFSNTTAMFTSWTEWANSNGEFVGSVKRFVSALETRGFHQYRKMDGRGFTGLRLKPQTWGSGYEP
jgi:putative DNA primase/helicase